MTPETTREPSVEDAAATATASWLVVAADGEGATGNAVIADGSCTFVGERGI
jgi:hypothetical protein